MVSVARMPRPLVLVLATLALALAWLPSSSAYPAPNATTIGILLPLTGSQSNHGLRMKAVFDLFASAVNANYDLGLRQNLSLGGPLTLQYEDSKGDPVTAMAAVYRMAANPALYGIIGELNDNVTTVTGMLTSQLGILNFTPASSTPSTQDTEVYPYLWRTRLNSEWFARIWVNSFATLKWYRIALISSDDDDGRGYADALLRGATTAGVNVTGGVFDFDSIVLPAHDGDGVDAIVAQALDQLLQGDKRIFMLHANELNEKVMRMAHARGMVGMGSDGVIRQWVGEFCSPELALRMQDVPAALYGATCTQDTNPRVYADDSPNPTMVSFEKFLISTYPEVFANGNSPRLTSSDVSAANALIGMVSVLSVAFNDPTYGNTVDDFASVLSVPFTVDQLGGLPMTFMPNGDCLVNADIVFWSMEEKRFVASATLDRLTGAYQPTNRPNVYANGLASFPKDRARIYVTDDVLPRTFDGKIVVLSYVVAVLGAWTAHILLEQALSFWSRGGWVIATGWVALAGIAFGGCSIFPLFAMIHTSIVLDSDASIYLEVGPIVGAAIFPVFGTALGLMVALWSVPGGRKPAPNVNVNEVSDLSRTSETSVSGSSANSRSRASGAIRMIQSRVTKQLNKFKEFMVEVAVQSQWRLPLGAAILSATMLIEHVIIAQAFYLKAHMATPGAAYGEAIFATFFINLIALLLYLHVTRNGVRYLAPLVLAVSSLADYFLLVGSSVWKYDGAVDISSHGLSGKIAANSSFAVIVAVVCAAICFGLMVFNVNRLRLSRNTLDKVLSQVAGQVRALEADIEYEKEATGALAEQAAFFRRALEVINLCRPVWRPYSIAMALADPDEAAAERALTKPMVGAGVVAQLEKARPSVPKAHKHGKGSLDIPAGGRKSGVEASHSGSASSANQGDDAPPSSGGGKESSNNKEAKPLLVNAVSTVAGKEASQAGSVSGATSGPIAGELPGQTLAGGRGANSASTPSQTPADGNDAGASASTGSSDKEKSHEIGSDWQRVHAPKQSKSLASLLSDLKELGNLETPAPSRALQDIKLPQILSHPATLELMKDVLAKNLSPENIALWIDIQRYHSLETAQVRKAVADEIFQTFIVSGAKYEVNLSSFMRDWVQTQINRGQITAELFDEVEREIYRLMVTNNVDALVGSQMFKLAALLLQHPAYNLKSMSLANNTTGAIGGNLPSLIGSTVGAGNNGGGGGGGSSYMSSTPVASTGLQQRGAGSRGPAPPRASGSVAPSTPVGGRTPQLVAQQGNPGTPRSNNFIGYPAPAPASANTTPRRSVTPIAGGAAIEMMAQGQK